MANSKSHCSVDYHNFNGDKLDIKAHLVAEGIYSNNPPFAAPPLTQAAYNALVEAHHDKYEAYKNGGKAQKGPYNTARTALIKAMDDTGDYVDLLPGVDDDMILLAGFTPTKTGATKTVVPNPATGVKLTLGVTTEMFSDCDAQPGDNYYGSIMVAGQPLPEDFTISNAGQVITTASKPDPDPEAKAEEKIVFILDLTKKRQKHYTGLTKGVEYYCYYYVVNTAGVSQLSAPVILMCG